MTNEKPLILICNDDGITAPGINALVREMMPLGELVVVAPDSPQSGTGHGITINDTLRINPEKIWDGVKSYSCSGTPVDCIKVAVTKLLDREPDLIVSGINHGSNASINVIYSGTMSAAVEGAVEGIPSIGFSLLDHSIDADFTASSHFAGKVAKKVLENGLPKGVCLNVNIPKLGLDEIEGTKVCRQAEANWIEELDTRIDPTGKEYYWLKGKFVNYDEGEDTDIWALEHNYVSIVPVQYDLTAHTALPEMEKMNFDA